MLMDQAAPLRQMVSESSPSRAQVVAVTSGKGGVGKSCVAVNLAARLAQMGRRAVLMDADLGTANVDVLCNVFASDSLAHVVAGRRTLGQTMIDAPGGFRLIPGASGLGQMAALSEFERTRLIDQMRELEDEADLIIIDTGAGISPNVLGFALSAHRLIVVTTPEPTSITDAYAMIKTVSQRRQDCNLSILVNMVHSEAEGRSVFDRIDTVCRRFLNLTVGYAGYLLYDPRVSLAVHRRRLFVLDAPQCSASRCIERLAHCLDGQVRHPRSPSIWQRMTNWFVE